MTQRPTASSKIVPLDVLLERLEPLRGHWRIVFTNGCFDLLHPGHVDLLERARALGDVLVVGLNSDASVTGLKGPTRPVTPWPDRADVLAGLASVDFVVDFSEPTPRRLVAAIRPDVLVKGGDWPVSAIEGRETVLAVGGRVVSLPLLPGHSTTAAIERIVRLAGRKSEKP